MNLSLFSFSLTAVLFERSFKPAIKDFIFVFWNIKERFYYGNFTFIPTRLQRSSSSSSILLLSRAAGEPKKISSVSLANE
jgi:hypothetical protein